MRLVLLIVLLTLSLNSFSQEAMLNDLSGMSGMYWIKEDLIKQIKKEKDTINYYHDTEIIIYYNQVKTKNLEPNTFYIINHGFNKLVTMNVLFVMVEATNDRKKKDTLFTNPKSIMEVFKEDSLARSAYTYFGIRIIQNVYRKAAIKALLLEINYYGKTIYRWFGKELDASILPERKKPLLRTI